MRNTSIVSLVSLRSVVVLLETRFFVAFSSHFLKISLENSSGIPTHCLTVSSISTTQLRYPSLRIHHIRQIPSDQLCNDVRQSRQTRDFPSDKHRQGDRWIEIPSRHCATKEDHYSKCYTNRESAPFFTGEAKDDIDEDEGADEFDEEFAGEGVHWRRGVVKRLCIGEMCRIGESEKECWV